MKRRQNISSLIAKQARLQNTRVIYLGLALLFATRFIASAYSLVLIIVVGGYSPTDFIADLVILVLCGVVMYSFFRMAARIKAVLDDPAALERHRDDGSSSILKLLFPVRPF